MDKKNLLIILLVMVLAAALLALSGTMKKPADITEDTVVITVDGKEYRRVPLSDPQEVVISQKDGAENVVRVTEKGAVMLSSTCDNQLCVHMGEVTVENWQYRVNQQFIVCLPNRVSIELVVHE